MPHGREFLKIFRTGAAVGWDFSGENLQKKSWWSMGGGGTTPLK